MFALPPKTDIFGLRLACPLNPQKRTSGAAFQMSAKDQERIFISSIAMTALRLDPANYRMTTHAEAVMSKYVWQHDLKGESDRLRLMSDLLDPSSEFHLLRIGVATGWRCLEIGAGNGSLSQWLAQRVGPFGDFAVETR